jgi:BNR repeat-like domain/Secretion system C-terminal sorting domain
METRFDLSCARFIAYISPSDPNSAWIEAYDINVPTKVNFFTTSDGGATLNLTNSPIATGNVIGVSEAADSNSMYVIFGSTTTYAKIYVKETHNKGKTWTKVPKVFTNAASFPDAIHFWDAQNGCMLGDPVDGYYEIYTTADAGKTWTRVAETPDLTATSATEYGIIGVYSASSDGGLFVPGIESSTSAWLRMLRSEDKGATWASFDMPIEVNDYGTTIPGDDILITAGSKNDVLIRRVYKNADNIIEPIAFVSHDGCQNWGEPTLIELPENKNSAYYGITMIPGTTILTTALVNLDDSLFTAISTDDGATWNLKHVDTYELSPEVFTITGGDGALDFMQFSSPKNGWLSVPDGVYRSSGGLFPVAAKDIPSLQLSLKSYPNPATELVNIEFALDNTTATDVAVYDMTGRKVSQLVSLIAPLSAGKQQLKWKPTANGTFTLRIAADGMLVTRQIVVTGL